MYSFPTPAMIAAGADYLLEALADRLPENWPLAEVVATEMFQKMMEPSYDSRRI